MSNTTNASASLELSKHLNRIGNGDANKLVSIDISNFLGMVSQDDCDKILITGGIGDGTSNIPEDDLDYMIVSQNVTCTETGNDIVPNENQLNLTVEFVTETGNDIVRNAVHFTMQPRRHRPGFVLMKLLSDEELSGDIETVFVDITGEGLCVSSANFVQCFLSNFIATDQFFSSKYSSGPAITMSGKCEDLTIKSDNVPSIFCPKWPDEAKAWPERVRKCSWPPGEIIQAIMNSGCHIVPKGSHGGEFSAHEWCISFSMHEKGLIRSFSSIQHHHYILLKRILKNKFLDKYPNVMTSYVAKTVCLWQMELNKREMWQTKYLVDRLIKSMLFLRDCIYKRYLPHYFIPENNIVHGKVTLQMRDDLVKDLSDFVSVFIDRCNRPKELIRFLFWKNEHVDNFAMGIKLRLSCYYGYLYQNINSFAEMSFQQIETIHGSVMSTYNIFKQQKVFNDLHKLLLNVVCESELQTEDYQRRLELILLLQHLSNSCGFSSKVRVAEIYYLLGQPNKCIDIIMEALTMHTTVALKGCNDILNRDNDELLGIIKTRPLMSLSQFLTTYIIKPIIFSEENIILWSHILQHDIFQHLIVRPIEVDALVYAYFLLSLALHSSSRPEKAEEAVNTLICLITEEPSNLDYRDVASCLLNYVVHFTSRPRTVM